MALGMIEVFGFATSIVVADAMAKAADVKVVAIDKNKPAAGDSARVPLVMAIKVHPLGMPAHWPSGLLSTASTSQLAALWPL